MKNVIIGLFFLFLFAACAPQKVKPTQVEDGLPGIAKTG